MIKRSLIIHALLLLGLFSLGIFVGISIVSDDDEGPLETTEPDSHPVSDPSPVPFVNPMNTSVDSYIAGDSEYSQLLENKVAELEARVFELEQVVAPQPEVITEPSPSRSEANFRQMNNQQTMAALAKAGISEEIAADIIRRRSDIELKKLELHDRASRDANLGSPRYQSELSELNAQATTLREELGDDAYDRYLYANGQPNRVKVISVMMGSAAERAGMKDGDLIVNYGQHRLFEWTELKRATSEGILGDYVSVDVIRNEQLMNLSVPRGPLGVRLGTARLAP